MAVSGVRLSESVVNNQRLPHWQHLW